MTNNLEAPLLAPSLFGVSSELELLLEDAWSSSPADSYWTWDLNLSSRPSSCRTSWLVTGPTGLVTRFKASKVEMFMSRLDELCFPTSF